MKLTDILAESASKRDALELQQNIIEHCDFDVDIKIILHPNSDEGVLRLTFPDWKHSNDDIASVNFLRIDENITVGIEGLGRSHLTIRSESGAGFKSLSSPDIGQVIRRECCRRVGIQEKGALGERAKFYASKAQYKGIFNNMPGDDDFTPFHYAPWLSSDQEQALGEVALKGKEAVCMAIRKPTKDVIGGSDALNKFNDEVLRKSPRPKQLAMATTTDVTWFLYAPQ